MNPLAQLMQQRGHQVQGSDRGFDQGQNQEVAELLSALGISLLPQDGSAIHNDLDLVVHSAAVEMQTPEMQRCTEFGLARQSRPQLLAELVNAATPGIAISGTSGKSSVVGLITWMLRQCQQPVNVLGGAALAEGGRSYMGCFQAATAQDPLLAEACESDGTLIEYHAGIGLIHNITRDHDELAGLKQQFQQFADQSSVLLYNKRCALSAEIASVHPHALSYGLKDAGVQLDILRDGPLRGEALISYKGREYEIDMPQPGRYNLENVCAAFAVLTQLDVDLNQAAAAVQSFPGIARRYQCIGQTESQIRIIDDYAHNADKIQSVVQAAQLSSDRVIALFQPHGFGPARFLRPELKTLLPQLLRPQDKWVYLPIFYAGGTVSQDISSEMLAQDLIVTGQVHAVADRQTLLTYLAEEARPNDTILLMGARDPALPQLARSICGLL